jgi:hypothetical protein
LWSLNDPQTGRLHESGLFDKRDPLELPSMFSGMFGPELRQW